MSEVLVRHWAAARAAAGTAEERADGVATLAELGDLLVRRHGPRYAEVLARCSFLVDEVSPGTCPHPEVALAPGAVVDVLPPFSGGSRPAPHHASDPRDLGEMGVTAPGSPPLTTITGGVGTARDGTGLGCS